MKRAFTLIELLVVIAIIAILAAILFPVFAQAKAAAKKTQALSNVKQTTLGVIMYMGDSDDTFPIGSGYCWYYPTDGGWAWDTQPYMKSLGILRDPSDPLSSAWRQSWFDDTISRISFASNGLIAWTGSTNDTVGVMGMLQGAEIKGVQTRCGTGDNWGGYFGVSVVTQSAVNRVADTIALSARFGGNNVYGGGDIMTNNTGWDSSGPQATPDGRRDGTKSYLAADAKGGTTLVNVDQRFGAVGAPYGNLGVFSFVDGHAKSMNPVATNPNQDANPEKNLWNRTRQ